MRKRKHIWSKQKTLWTILFVLLLFMVAPIVWVILGAFKTNAEIFGQPFALPKSWDFSNLKDAWVIGKFGQYILNSAYITIGGMFLVFLVAGPAGYALAQMKFRGRSLWFFYFLIGLAIPVQSIIIPIFFQLKSMSLLDTLTGVMLVSAAIALPFAVFLMRNSFRDVPKEIREAAIVDGASEWRSYFSVMLPMAKPGVVTMMVFTFMQIWNDFMIPLVLLISDSNFTVALGLYAFNQEQSTQYSLVFGGTLISMIPSIIVYLIFQRQFVAGMAAGGGK